MFRKSLFILLADLSWKVRIVFPKADPASGSMHCWAAPIDRVLDLASDSIASPNLASAARLRRRTARMLSGLSGPRLRP